MSLNAERAFTYETTNVVETTISVSTRTGEQLLSTLEGSETKDLIFLVDKKVSCHYLPVIAMVEKKYHCSVIELDAHESTKSWGVYNRVCKTCLEMSATRTTQIVGFGGGTVCDLAGFVAATLLRGIPLILIPTSLMNMCDAAIGWKQGINGEGGKNLIGSFYAPHLILLNLTYLETLDDFWLRDGYAEIIKLGLSHDIELYSLLLEHHREYRDFDFLRDVVSRAIEIKLKVMRHDPQERAAALILQYGHTFGHALEVESIFSIPHGHAVAMGFYFAQSLACRLGHSTEETLKSCKEILNRFELISNLSDISISSAIEGIFLCKRFLSRNEASFLMVGQLGSLQAINGNPEIPVSVEQVRQMGQWVATR